MINPQIHVASEALSAAYLNAANYPNIVLDNFLDPTVLMAVSNEAKYLTEHIQDEEWRFGTPDYHRDQVLKRGIKDLRNMTPVMELVCAYMNSETFVQILRDLTGIDDLVPDWALEGGGFHVTYPGGKLGIHHDFNYKDDMGPDRMYRKVNLLVYLNEHWEQSWGGSLELWYSNLSGAFKQIDLIHNRAVLFNIEDAPHGHPDPLNCPIGENRRSLAFYYYSKTPPNNRLYDRAHWLHNGQLV
jgi:hypothetical protein